MNDTRKPAEVATGYRLTYSTMFDPPESLHQRFEAALDEIRPTLGADHPMWIGGAEVTDKALFDLRSPIDHQVLVGRFPLGSADHAAAAVDAAGTAFGDWSRRPWRERIALLRRAAMLIEERVWRLSACLSIEVGKNRMESLGEVQETADLINWYCDRFEEADGFDRILPDDPLTGWTSRNRTRLRPYGVWAVIAPFNFPYALAGGPIAAALVTGNTVVFKTASDTALSGALLMQVFRDAGLPDGVLNHVTGPGGSIGDALARHPDVAGMTFTGSHEVGMSIAREYAGGRWPRPCIAEMGGKNPTIVTDRADLERAAAGIVRSAFGLQGQKCSACSRLYVHKAVEAELRERLVELTEAITVGNPTLRENWMGPVINRAAHERYRKAIGAIGEAGKAHAGARVLDDGDLARGWFAAPTIASLPHDHPLWHEEQFLPLLLMQRVDSLDEAIGLANQSDLALAAGFYGDADEADVFAERIEAGVIYLNRPQGATTGAWPGYQPFGGWKGSGSTGKAIGSWWYLPLYMREQSRTIVD
ncbi:MAG: aldehyde dehydrogenase family protein [Pseudomonadota bacterium]|jgi:1-pyrroline-5-carboxylate dehydrogenase|nr:aldehyde dehydrogenase family protein [Pseudomonadota bacterium]